MNSADQGRRLSRTALVSFGAMALVYFFSYIQRAAVPGTIFDELSLDFGLSAVGIAALGALFTWTYGGMQVFVGMLVDGWGGRRNLIGGGLAMAVGSLLFPLAQSTPLLFASRALVGFGASFLYLAIVKEIHLAFKPRHFSAGLGALLAIGYTGSMVATLPFERAVASFGWRPSLLVIAALTFVALAAAWALPGSGTASSGKAGGGSPSFASLAKVLANRRAWPSFGSSAIAFPIYFAVLTLLGKKFLQDRAGLGSAAAASVLLAMTVTSASTVLAGGILPRLCGGRNKPGILAGALSLVASMAILLAGILFGGGAAVYLAAYLLLALAIGVSQPSGGATLRDLNDPGLVASGISIANALAYIGCGTIAQVSGAILDGFRPAGAISMPVAYPMTAYAALFAFLFALALLNLGLTLAIPETGGPARAARKPC